MDISCKSFWGNCLLPGFGVMWNVWESSTNKIQNSQHYWFWNPATEGACSKTDFDEALMWQLIQPVGGGLLLLLCFFYWVFIKYQMVLEHLKHLILPLRFFEVCPLSIKEVIYSCSLYYFRLRHNIAVFKISIFFIAIQIRRPF